MLGLDQSIKFQQNMKSKVTLLIILISLTIGCQKNKLTNHKLIQEGMVKMTIFYPNIEGKEFDMDYYSNKHMPMAVNLFGNSLKAMSIDKGLSGRTADIPSPYFAIGYFYFENVDTFKNSLKQNSEKLRADVQNYTNVKPIIQISEVVTHQ